MCAAWRKKTRLKPPCGAAVWAVGRAQRFMIFSKPGRIGTKRRASALGRFCGSVFGKKSTCHLRRDENRDESRNHRHQIADRAENIGGAQGIIGER